MFYGCKETELKAFGFGGGSYKMKVESYCQTKLSDLGMVTGQIPSLIWRDKLATVTWLYSNPIDPKVK